MLFCFQTIKMIIYLYLFMLFLFVSTDSSSIRSRNNKNELVPVKSSRSASERKDIGKESISQDPFFAQLRMTNLGDFESSRKDKKKKRPGKKRISKSLKKRQRTRRELQLPKLKSIRRDHLTSQVSQSVNKTEKLQNVTNTIRKVDILKALSDYSKKPEIKTADPNFKTYKRKDAETAKHATSTRNHNNHHLSEPLLKMVYPSAPKTDRLSHKYTYKDLITDRERLEQKIKYMKNMLNVNDTTVDDVGRVRRRSDYKIPKMFLTLSAVNGLHGRRKLKCEEDDDEDNRVQDVWEKDRREGLSRKSSSSNEQRYKVKKWIEFMKNKRSYGKTCPCMGTGGEERDVFPLEQTLPKDYLLMERQDSSEESSETYKDQFYSSRDKPLRESLTKRRQNKNQEDQDSKLKGLPKNGKKNSDMNFTDLELYRSRAKQILRNAEEILDRIKEEEEKRIAAPNLFMSRLRELTSAIQGDPRNNENDLIRKLQKNLGWGPLSKSEEGNDGNQLMQNVKSLILDPYEKAKALTDESTRRLTSYLLQNLGKIQEPSEEQREAANNEDEIGPDNMQYFEQLLSKDEKPLPDSLTREDSRVDPNDPLKSFTNLEDQRMDDIIQQQHIKSDEHEMTQNPNGREETERVGEKATETVRENEEPHLEDKVSIQLNEYDTDRISESREKAPEGTEEVGKEKPPAGTEEVGKEKPPAGTEEVGKEKPPAGTEDVEKEKPSAENLFLHSEGSTQGEKGDNKGSTSGDMPKEEKAEEILEEIMKTINKDMGAMTEDREKVGNLRNDGDEDHNTQAGEELTQRKQNSEDANEQEEVQEVVASSQKTSGEISERDENDVVSSPHLADDYDFLSERENQDTGRPTLLTDLSSPEERTPTGNEQYVKAFNEDPTQIKTNEETVLENQENVEAQKDDTEPILNLSKELSNIDSKEAADLEEQVSEKKPMEGKEVSNDEKQDEEMTDVESAKKPLESADLVKANRASTESSETEELSDTYPKNKLNEGMEDTAWDEDTLKMEQSNIENNRSIGTESAERNADGETLLKLDSKIEDSEDIEGEDNQKNPSDSTLRLTLDENSNDQGTEKAAGDDQDEQSIESREETPLRAENSQTSKEDSSREILLKDTLETEDVGENYEANLRAEKPTEETENQESDKNGDESNEEAILKEARDTKNPEEISLTLISNDGDETDSRKTSSEVNSNEDRATEEGNDTPLKANRDEGLEEDDETPRVESTNQEGKDDTQNLRKFSDSEMPKDEEGEETLRSENMGEAEGNQLNEEKEESTQETNDKLISEESDENLKLAKSANYEDDNTGSTVGLKEDQENSEEGSTLQASDPREELDFQTENEDTLKSKNPNLETENENEETSREIQTSRNQENLETDDETALQQANPQENAKEEQNSSKAIKSALEDDTEGNLEVESSETIKAANPEDRNQNVENQNADGDSESVKAVFEDEEPKVEQETAKAVFEDEEPKEEEETVKAVMESETQDNSEDSERLRAASSLEKVDERKSSEDDFEESVKSVLGDEIQEKLDENEAVKAVNSEENLENDDVLKKALENVETVDGGETVQEKAKFNKEFEQFKEPMDNEEKAAVEDELEESTGTQTEGDETPLRAALSQENLEEADETLKAENPNVEENEEADSGESLRSAIMEELGNKIEDESPLRAENPMHGIDEDGDSNRSAIEESLREISSSEADENKDETLKSENFNMHQTGRSLNRPGYESLLEDLLGDYTAEDSPLREAGQDAETEDGSERPDLVQVPESTSKSLKGGRLKVPKSIGKIMSVLEGPTKGDLTSIQNLNPDKIDHIIDKIGEAEQNLLESQEVDCRKECACAEEMDTRSRNIGRYEIAKDILHWLKDLQLNRVLSDE